MHRLRSIYTRVRLLLLIALTGLLVYLAVTNGRLLSIRARTLGQFAARNVSPAPTGERRLLELGWRTPYLQDMPDYVDAAQDLPFDGLILDARSPDDRRGMSWVLFGKKRVSQEEFDAIAAEVEDLEWGRLTDNFLRLNVHKGGKFDWYETDFDPIMENAEAWARLAHDLEFEGLMLDTEQYGGSITFDYEKQPGRDQHSFEEYAEQAYRRGQEYMQALNRGHPGLTIIYTYGPSSRAFLPSWYALLHPFLEGMIDAADEGTTLVDGYEFSYFYKSEKDFLLGRELIADITPAFHASDPERYRETVQVGFGLWLDHECDKSGLLPGGCPNGFTPEEFERSVALALRYSDRYVWVYSERIDWYTGEGIPPDWADTLESLN